MTAIICIANQKGGVGKTTTSVNLAAAIGVCEKKVLLVDCDPQGNATTGMGIDKGALKNTLYQAMIGKAEPFELIADTDIKYLKVIPSEVDLIGFEVEMMEVKDREKILKNMLGKIQTEFDYIILDCPPSLSLLTINAMTAASWLLIPLQCEFYALEGLGQLMNTMKRINAGINPDLKILGILLTMFDKRTNLSYQVAEEAEQYFKKLVFKTKIPRNIKLSEAPSFGKPVILYDAGSIGSQSYMELASEIITR